MSGTARRRLGWSWLLAATVGAPVAALLVSFALPAVIPASQGTRYLVASLVVVPLIAAAPCGVLLARSAARAWVGVLSASAAATLVLLWSVFT
ncbi:hypothetical protein MYSTI_02036 [Myxococcus stipitatus DSM 14675]|uniref:Uncharacterized protein n=1 Tax=Myxococcus stipitatus (strain DSM 14675 / JCM 12634 / Mx s8) TaxID=1278073 RepID=L7U682_MYXSD|nr:hypothetical protein [Myxococcus stipitatus]AGC43365.1 hypothetical protein MYSTI_02036 [Myxococcus stipitatus DSM 14675]